MLGVREVPETRYARNPDGLHIAYDLVAGSGIVFQDRGEHDLKGVPGTWRMFAVVD
jgi:hypothetical protein